MNIFRHLVEKQDPNEFSSICNDFKNAPDTVHDSFYKCKHTPESNNAHKYFYTLLSPLFFPIKTFVELQVLFCKNHRCA